LLRLRRQVSFLLAEGHPEAARYPVGVLWSEAIIAQQRLNAQHATQAALVQMAIVSVLGGKEAGRNFSDQIQRLTDGNE
jgi:hypothetical protein